jgi:thiol-disulfide isomerase/thioredoxin
MKTTYVYIALVVAVVALLVVAKNYSGGTAQAVTSSVYDTFAECLSNAGAKFYGAYWCPHCQAQKKLFENSKKLPYVECSTPNGQGQVQVCNDLGIKSYPTWIFADGTRGDGEQTFAQLSEKTNCPIPETK